MEGIDGNHKASSSVARNVLPARDVLFYTYVTPSALLLTHRRLCWEVMIMDHNTD